MRSEHWKTQPRQPKGTPIGGEWDNIVGGGAATSLGAFDDEDSPSGPTTPRWGRVDIQTGSRTPWGRADHVVAVAPGIAFVATASHGGMKLSSERNQAVPAPLRRESGWYEEDVDAAIVDFVFADDIGEHSGRAEPEAIRLGAAATIKDWHPDQWEQATGEVVSDEESATRRRQARDARIAETMRHNSDAYKVVSAIGSNSSDPWLPDGWVKVTAERDGDRRVFLVPRESYSPDIPIKASAHIDVTAIDTIGQEADDSGPLVHDLGVDLSGLTANQAERARRELSERYRWHDGRVESLGNRLERVGAKGKVATYGSKGEWHVRLGAGETVGVSKATWDALGGVPDTTTALSRLSNDRDRAADAYQKARAKAAKSLKAKDRAAMDKAKAEADRAERAYKDAFDADIAQTRARMARRNQAKAAAFQRLCDERGLVFS